MILTTRRLVMREFKEEDWPAVLAYQSNPLYLRYNPWNVRTEQDVRAFVGMFLEQQLQVPRMKFQLAITLPSTGQLIGNCGIRKRSLDAREADIGYELDPRFWGKGYATEAASKMLEFGFREMGLHRVWAWCLAENVASAHVLRKIGMRQEAHLRENEWLKNRWWDTLYFAMLDREWHA